MAIVTHHTKVKIIESNMVSIRPGSVYENTTYFESLFEWPNPGFNYRFVDTGLGVADPIYPLYQKGHQGNWFQLLVAMFGEGVSRHIDHYTSLSVAEGCQVDSLYMLRNIGEFPKNLYAEERAQGFKQIVIRLEYYTKLASDVSCGHHKINDPDPKFNPMKWLKRHTRAKSLADFPQKELAKFEAHVAAIRHLSQEFSRTKWPRFNLNDLKDNSLWYYPKGHSEDFDMPAAKNLILPASPELRLSSPLSTFVEPTDWARMLDFLSGKPSAEYLRSQEPGKDSFSLSDVKPNNIYTSGNRREQIKDVWSDITDTSNFDLVGLVLHPFVEQGDIHFGDDLAVVPQVRLTFQLKNPRNPNEHFEQLFFHLNFDVVDREAEEEAQMEQHLYFLERIRELTAARNNEQSNYADLLSAFVEEFTRSPVRDLSFSSALTGIWVFGLMSRNYSEDRVLKPIRIVRQGVDVGYYSTVYDNEVFRKAIKESSGRERESLENLMEDLRVDYYRDPKRQNVEKIRFDRVTCAQCHHLSARDGVHFSFNDSINPNDSRHYRATEFMFHEAERQLRNGGDHGLLGFGF